MPENRGPQVSGVSGFFLVLSTIFTLMRCYCRVAIVKSFGPDDYLAVLAQILYIFFCAFAITGVQYGTGQHAIDITPQSNIPIGLKWWWACEPVYVLCNMFLKWSIGLFLLRIAVTRIQKAIIWLVMTVTGVISMYFFFLFVFQCWPVAFFWEQYTGAQGSCIDPKIITISTYVYSALSCASDWTLCILPGFMVWKLQMNPRTKISVCLILALSAIASAATIIRMPYVPGLQNVNDFLYATTDVAIWSISETGLGLTASAAATLRPLFRSFLSRSRLLGGSTKTDTAPWGSSRAGYLRSGRNDQEIGLRSDVGKNAGVTTIIDSRSKPRGHSDDDKSYGVEVNSLEAQQNWNTSQSKLTETSSEEFGTRDWSHGIKKTTVISSHRS